MVSSKQGFLAGALGIMVVLPASGTWAVAESAFECTCKTTVASEVQSKSIGSLSGVSGDVFVSRPQGFAEATPGDRLSVDSKVIIGVKSSASMQVGSCALSAPEDSTVGFSYSQGKICLRVVKTFDETIAAGAHGQDANGVDCLDPSIAPGCVGVATTVVGVTVGGIIAASDNKRRVSP